MNQDNISLDNKEVFVVGREILMANTLLAHVHYFSMMQSPHANKFWESKDALKACKKYAKEQGFKQVLIARLSWKQREKWYKL